MGSIAKRLAAIFLAAVLVTTFSFSTLSELTLSLASAIESDAVSFDYDDEVIIMVKLESEPFLATSSLEDTRSSDMIAELSKQHDAAIELIQDEFLSGNELDILYRYSLLFNGFSFVGEYHLVDEIKTLSCVKDCYVSARWKLPEEQESEATRLSNSIPVINADDIWTMGYTGENKTVAVIDTGILVSHPNFSVAPPSPYFDVSAVSDVFANYDLLAEQQYSGTLTANDVYYSSKLPYTFNYVTRTPDVSHGVSGSDHGTHVASIAAGYDANHKGVAYNSQIIAMNVFNNLYEDWAIVLAALEDCAYIGVDSLNMSFGDDCGISTGGEDIDRVFDLLHATGVNCAAAAGNSSTVAEGNSLGGRSLASNPDNGAIASPSTYEVPLAVAACNNYTEVCYFSSWGPTSDLKIKPEVMAPGSSINAATDPSYSGSQYSTKSGTSMASPHVAGAMALLDQYVSTEFPQLTPAERTDMVNTLMMCTAHPALYNEQTLLPYSPRLQGAGVVDLAASLATTAYIEVNDNVRPKLEIGDDPERTGVFTFSFDIVNFGDTALTYIVSGNVQTEKTNDGSLHYMDETPFSLDDTAHVIAPNQVTVPANGRTTVTITVDASEARSYLDSRFSNGIYIEGYISLDGAVDLSIPYLGFYGGWDEAPVIEPAIYWDEMMGNSTHETWGLNLAAFTNIQTDYALGENPFIASNDFYADRISISPNGDNRYDSVNTINTYMLRAARDFTYTITDENENIIYQKVCPLVRKTCSYYDENPVGVLPGTAIDPFTGAGFNEGDTFTFTMSANLMYDGFNPENCTASSWSFPVTIDTTAPEILYWKLEGGQLIVYVRDAHYVAHVGVYATSNYTQPIAETAVTETRRNAMTMLTFDVGNRDSVYVKVGDYAMNVTSTQLSGEGGSYEHISLDGITLEHDQIVAYENFSSTIRLLPDPIDANTFTTEWSIADTNIAIVEGSMMHATITGVNAGVTTLTCVATDSDTGESFTATAQVVINDYPTISEAANAQGSNLVFTTSGQYMWSVLFMDERVAIQSGNQGSHNSSSSVSTSVSMQDGDELHFDWMVSSERNYDELVFYVNGSEYEAISGEYGWQECIYTASTSATYHFEWRYTKDTSVNSGSDAGFIDDVYVRHVDEGEYDLGDVNGDGSITAGDALLAIRQALGILTLTPAQFNAADFNGDGQVTASDALEILRITIQE